MRNSLNSSPLCEVSFAHTCANTFFKKYHSHLKWVLKGFHSEIMLSSIDKFLYLLTRTLHSYKSESSVIFLSKKYIPLYKETVQNGATLCKECHIIWKVPLHKGIFIYIYIHIRGCCFENEFQRWCWNLLVSSISGLGCVVFLPMVLQ